MQSVGIGREDITPGNSGRSVHYTLHPGADDSVGLFVWHTNPKAPGLSHTHIKSANSWPQQALYGVPTFWAHSNTCLAPASPNLATRAHWGMQRPPDPLPSAPDACRTLHTVLTVMACTGAWRLCAASGTACLHTQQACAQL